MKEKITNFWSYLTDKINKTFALYAMVILLILVLLSFICTFSDTIKYGTIIVLAIYCLTLRRYYKLHTFLLASSNKKLVELTNAITALSTGKQNLKDAKLVVEEQSNYIKTLEERIQNTQKHLTDSNDRLAKQDEELVNNINKIKQLEQELLNTQEVLLRATQTAAEKDKYIEELQAKFNQAKVPYVATPSTPQTEIKKKSKKTTSSKKKLDKSETVD